MKNELKMKSVTADERERDRKHTILRAAVEVFATKGYHGCRIADVATEAHVAYGLVYHYFKNKEALLQAVFDLGFRLLSGSLKSVAQSSETFEHKVKAIADFSFDAYRADPRLVRVLILQIARSPAVGGMNRYHAFGEIIHVLIDMFAEGQRKGELREDMDPALAAALLFGVVEMGLTGFVVGLYDSEDADSLARAKRQVTETFLRGVVPTAAEEMAVNARRSSARPKAVKPA